MSDTLDSTTTAKHPTRSSAHQGLQAGALGATVVWLWFAVSDWLNGSPLHLATMFGRGLLDLVGGATASIWPPVLVFTIVHFAYWVLLAVIILKFVEAARGNPSVLGLAATLFILAQFLFAGITAILSNGGLGVFAWPSVWLGNFAGWAAAWWLIERHHPELRGEFRHMNDDV